VTDFSFFLVSMTAAKLKRFKAAYRILRSAGVNHHEACEILHSASENLNRRNIDADLRRAVVAR
jgi:hypothetical protein